jgi:hypothetical protein
MFSPQDSTLKYSLFKPMLKFQKFNNTRLKGRHKTEILGQQKNSTLLQLSERKKRCTMLEEIVGQ